MTIKRSRKKNVNWFSHPQPIDLKKDPGFNLKSKILLRFFIGTVLVSLLFSGSPAAYAQTRNAGPQMRNLTVGVAVTPSFQKIPAWKDTFKKRLKYASSILERECKIKLKEVIFWTWDPDPSFDTRQLLDDLMARHPLSSKNVDIMIGLSKLEEISGSMNIRDLHVLGRTRPFSGYTLLRYPNNPLFKVQEETVLIHELGHLFGAMHTDNAETIMAPYADRQIPTTFDAANRQILSMTRGMDFRKGTESLPVEVIQQLLNSYNTMGQNSQSIDFYYALARFYLKLGQDDNALRTLEQLSAMEPEDGQIHYDLGTMYFKTGQMEKAQKELSTAVLQLVGPNAKASKAKAYNLLGQTHYRSGNMEGAHYNWTKALALDPNNLDLKINLAVTQLKRGQVTTAVNDLMKALEKSPDNPKILSNLGLAAYIAKKPEDSVRYYEKALQIYEKKKKDGKNFSQEDVFSMAEIYAGLGVSYWLLDKKKEAAQFFSTACQADPSIDCRMRMAKIYFEIQDWDQAVQHAVSALQTNKEEPELYGIIGVSLTRKGDLKTAVGVFQEGLRYAKDNKSASKFHANSGHLYLQLQQPDLALSEFTSAVAKDYTNRDAHFGLALTYLTKSMPVDARRALQNVLGLDPGHEQAKKLLVQTEKIIQEMQNQQITVTVGPGQN